MLCKRHHEDDIITNCKRIKISQATLDFKPPNSLCGKRKYAYVDSNEGRKTARLDPEISVIDNLGIQQNNKEEDDVPRLVISEITSDNEAKPKQTKNNNWNDILCGPEPRNHFARDYYAKGIQRVFKGWLIRRKYKDNKGNKGNKDNKDNRHNQTDTEGLIKYMNSMNIQ